MGDIRFMRVYYDDEGRDDPPDAYSLTYQFPSGLVANYSGDQFRNYHDFNCGCDVFGWNSYMETRYGGSTWMRGADWRYDGGEKKDLYQFGARTNIDTFHKNITGGVHENPTVQPSVNANLAAIMGRAAGAFGWALNEQPSGSCDCWRLLRVALSN